ncbi:diflavin oxidoreductase [Flavobacterium terrae]|uniref:assimilatory sulfite reductase (NADPH) n=1 Tax=Flavobacterium terrae TaxID=415425 RepID=A0A1M6GD60_9FLAO|nr:flavodoxin domain-containing protein [Flavobacterium terrae]SHJ07836.1 sulfite reductase (NADPH) flavoprotein alpha-component [Flavobacterium terrae]
MLSETKHNLLEQLVQNATNEELIYAKGFLAGYLAKNFGIETTGNVPVIQNNVPAVVVKPLIVYGTETGNSKKVASQIQATFKKNKIQAKSVDVAQFDLTKLQKETHVLFVISTQGEGEFPQNAVGFYEAVKAFNGKLDKLSFAVFGLGDSSYPLFCNAGVLLDEVLAEKGAKRLLPLVKADVDYANLIPTWESDLQNAFNTNGTTAASVVKAAVASSSHKQNFTGQITHKIVLNDRGSNKETYHLEITPNEEVTYEPGDALGLIPKNNETELLAITNHFGISDIAQLQNKNIRGLSKKSLEALGKIWDVTIEEEKADLVDVIKKYQPEKGALEDLLAVLHPIAPRLYSISSASEAHDGQVHLTVNLNSFKVGDELRTGLTSQFLADYPLDTDYDFYIHKNNNFRLPADDSDIILIGPGTGIAPFRSFLAQRDVTGAEGRNWLFFGEQHFALDFYYQTEIQEWLSTGVLTKLSTAFSRDQERKIYVQDRIKENAAEFNSWLESGASIYICGQKDPMSKDVENTIIEVIATQRNISIEKAKEVLDQLEEQGKYQKDVY